MRKFFLAAFLGILAGATSSYAQQSGAMQEGHLKQLDTSKNGSVSKAEYQTFMTEAFAKLDANSNGSLIETEVTGILTARQFGSLDANDDGRVTRTEFINQVMKDFALADRSGDGQLK